LAAAKIAQAETSNLSLSFGFCATNPFAANGLQAWEETDASELSPIGENKTFS